jgi:hypothetical protein
MRSFSFSRDVAPTTGAETTACTKGLAHGGKFLPASGTYEPSLVRIHAREIWAMLAPRFLAISSTLVGFKEVIAYIVK